MSIVGGRRGLWAAFVNAGVLIAVVDSLAHDCPNSAQVVSVGTIQTETAKARLLLLLSCLMELVCDADTIACTALEHYVSVVALTSYFIRDHHPEFFYEYRTYVLGSVN
jgi:hypothetical protein